MPPQKTTKGSKQKKKQEDTKKRELVTKDVDPSLEYAIVLKIHSTERVDVRCLDGKNRQAVISGSMKKKIYVQPGNLVLVSKRDYQDAKCDMSLKYFPHEVQTLIKNHGLPASFVSTEETQKAGGKVDDAVTFSQEDSDEEEKENQIKQQTKTYEMPESSDEEEEEIDEQKQAEQIAEKYAKEMEEYNQKKEQDKFNIKDKRINQQNKNKKKGDDSDSDIDIDDI
ncbi:Nucleic acid-binding, OB-fold [Pseudocohnilembus persalinus]|uniref:Nucleic acid-binding, OB-fold n=1 Tax=Pseudocohnilembus persalinus TaxID=266149 RepID=A0A0V0QI64_PSEPJ|nr:Nucleic acid-binding, OB-fold [Pseudocohnilembus persalinus]|eukprot:KRX01902.1 Nucleic acid-binding, OB-fold [Pseudocohnilembus persalinus]